MKTIKTVVARLARGVVVLLNDKPQTPVNLPVWLLWLL